MIEVHDITKTYTVAKKTEGAFSSIASLFRRTYHHVTALDRVSFSIKEGELIGYIGPNGAGKSTTVKILSGILVPDSGTCTVDGFVPWKDRKAYVRHIGVVFGQKTQLWWDLPVSDSFALLRDIYAIEPGAYKRSLEAVTELLSLGAFLDTPVRHLSLGQRMRCDLAASLLHSPRLLFLDEPTIGLDAVAKFAVRDFVRRINETMKVTVILTTHDMDDIEALAGRILILGDGRVAFDGSISTLRTSVPAHRYLVLDFPSKAEADHFTGTMKNLHGADLVDSEGGRVRMAFDPQLLPPQVLVKDITENHAFSDISIEHPPVEELIARIYRERLGQ